MIGVAIISRINRKWKVALFLIVGAYLLYPQSELLCPSWNVNVVGESQAPLADITVRRSFANFSGAKLFKSFTNSRICQQKVWPGR